MQTSQQTLEENETIRTSLRSEIDIDEEKATNNKICKENDDQIGNKIKDGVEKGNEMKNVGNLPMESAADDEEKNQNKIKSEQIEGKSKDRGMEHKKNKCSRNETKKQDTINERKTKQENKNSEEKNKTQEGKSKNNMIDQSVDKTNVNVIIRKDKKLKKEERTTKELEETYTHVKNEHKAHMESDSSKKNGDQTTSITKNQG